MDVSFRKKINEFIYIERCIEKKKFFELYLIYFRMNGERNSKNSRFIKHFDTIVK